MVQHFFKWYNISLKKTTTQKAPVGTINHALVFQVIQIALGGYFFSILGAKWGTWTGMEATFLSPITPVREHNV